MVALTEDACIAVRDLVAASPQLDGENGGLRIFSEPAGEGELRLQIALAAVPAEDDVVVEEAGARVFLDAEAATYLDDKVIDAERDDDRVRFDISSQG